MSDKIHSELQLLNDGLYIHRWSGSKRLMRPDQWKLGEVESYSGSLECLEDLISNFINHKNTDKKGLSLLAGWLLDLHEWVNKEALKFKSKDKNLQTEIVFKDPSKKLWTGLSK